MGLGAAGLSENPDGFQRLCEEELKCASLLKTRGSKRGRLEFPGRAAIGVE